MNFLGGTPIKKPTSPRSPSLSIPSPPCNEPFSLPSHPCSRCFFQRYLFLRLYGDLFVGFRDIFSSLAFDLMASSVLPNCHAINRVGVFPFAKFRNSVISRVAHVFPLLAGSFDISFSPFHHFHTSYFGPS